MRPLQRALIAAALVGAWLGVVAPSLRESLRAERAAGRIEPGTAQIASALASARRSLLPRGEEAARLAALLREAATETEIERAWTSRAAVVLDPSQRVDPGPGGDTLPRSRRQPWLDPELAALVGELGAAYGWQATALPEVPPFDPWPGVEPRRRVSALRGLVGSLQPGAGLTLHGLALDAAVAAARRDRAEVALRAQLSPELLALAAVQPGDLDHVRSAIAALLARAR